MHALRRLVDRHHEDICIRTCGINKIALVVLSTPQWPRVQLHVDMT
jgi:hypothetical protein